MAIQTDEIVPGEVTQAQWDGKFDATAKKIGDMGGASTQTADDLPEGTTNKYDTGVPPANTDELSEGATNKYDTGVPPSDLEELPDGATRKAMLDAEKTKLTGIAEGAEVNPADLDEVPDSATRKAMSDTEKTKLTGIEDSAKDDQTGAEVRDLIAALGDTERKILITNPETGEFKVIGVHRNAAGNLEYTYDDVPEA